MTDFDNTTEDIILVPASRAAEEFGVSYQTIINWHDGGLLQGTVIGRSRFVTRESLDKLKNVYPQVPAEAVAVEEYMTRVKQEQVLLEAQLSALKKERIYRGYAPVFIENLVGKTVRFIKRINPEGLPNELLDEKFIRCWLFGRDIQETCRENGVSYYHYQNAVKKYIKAISWLEHYPTVLERNRELQRELDAARKDMQRLYDEANIYRLRYESATGEGPKRKEDYPILSVDILNLELSQRTLNVLRTHGFNTLGQIIGFKEAHLMRLQGFGRKCLHEIKGMLEPYDLKFGMEIE